MSDVKFMYCLRWSGVKDTPMLRAALERCKDVTMFSHAEPVLVNREEYLALVSEGKVRKPETYWTVQEGQIGLVTLTNIGNSTQWEMVSNCKSDFMAGWEQAMNQK